MKRSTMILCLILAAAAVLPAAGSIEPDDEGWYEFPRLDDFDGVELKTRAELTLLRGDEYRVRARGDRRDIEDLDIYLSGDDLIIRRESLFRFSAPDRGPEIEVTLPRFSRAVITSSGSLRSGGRFECGDLELRSTGSGDMSVEAIADALECTATGSGSIEYRGRADELALKCTGSGGADIEIRANLVDVVLTGSGGAVLRGSADKMEARVTGNGGLKAADFPVRDADITLTGSGDAEVRVSGDLDARTSGSGSITYHGEPAHLDFQGSGSGKLRRR